MASSNKRAREDDLAPPAARAPTPARGMTVQLDEEHLARLVVNLIEKSNQKAAQSSSPSYFVYLNQLLSSWATGPDPEPGTDLSKMSDPAIKRFVGHLAPFVSNQIYHQSLTVLDGEKADVWHFTVLSEIDMPVISKMQRIREEYKHVVEIDYTQSDDCNPGRFIIRIYLSNDERVRDHFMDLNARCMTSDNDNPFLQTVSTLGRAPVTVGGGAGTQNELLSWLESCFPGGITFDEESRPKKRIVDEVRPISVWKFGLSLPFSQTRLLKFQQLPSLHSLRLIPDPIHSDRIILSPAVYIRSRTAGSKT